MSHTDYILKKKKGKRKEKCQEQALLEREKKENVNLIA